MYGTVLPLPKLGRPIEVTNATLKKIGDVSSQDDKIIAKELVTTLQGARISMSKSTTRRVVAYWAYNLRGLPIVNSSVHRTVKRDFRWAQE